MPTSLLDAAVLYRNSSLSVIPCKQKRPKVGWSEFQKAKPTDRQLTDMFSGTNYDQIAVICGEVSGNLEVIDVDLKNDTTGKLWGLLWNDLCEYFNNDMPLVVVNTMSGGVHLYYRCEIIEGNQKLASVPIEDTNQSRVIIETRGEGGYVIAPPSPHYTLAHGAIEYINTISPDQRLDILDICRKYNQVFKVEKQRSTSVQASTYKLTPWDAYNNDESDPWMEVLESAGWEITNVRDWQTADRIYYTKTGSDNKNKANWSKEKRLFYVFSTSTEFESEKAYSPFAIYAVLKHAGDFSAATGHLRKLGYGEQFTDGEEQVITKAFGLFEKGMDPYEILNLLSADFELLDPEVKNLGKQERAAEIEKGLEPLIHAAANRQAQAKGLFWTVGKKKIEISLLGMVEFLRAQGFRLFVQERASMLYRVVRIDTDSHIIEEVPIDVIKKWVEQWVRDNAEDYQVSKVMLLEAIMGFNGWDNIIQYTHRISIADVSFLRDTKTESFIPFRNCIVHITRKDIRPMAYQDLPKNMLLWSTQIKPIDIEILNLEDESQLNQCPVYRFIKRISGISIALETTGYKELRRTHPHLYARLMSFLTTAGYLLSNYKDPGRPYAIGLLEDTPNAKDGGGVGKDLFIKCLAWLRSVCSMPGKLWKPTANFAFQTYKFGDDILYLSDTDRFFNLEVMNNIITEGLTVERKNKDALTIPYDLSPKFAFSTNYNIDTSSMHAERRIKKLLFAKHYNKNIRPEDELGGMFWGPEWTHTDWMLFYLMLFTCIQTYLGSGLVDFQITENMKEKEIRLKFKDEFFDYMAEWINTNTKQWTAKTDMYEEFLYDSGLTNKEYPRKRFVDAVRYFGKTYDWTVTEEKYRKRGSERHNQHFLIFSKSGDKLPEMKDGIEI